MNLSRLRGGVVRLCLAAVLLGLAGCAATTSSPSAPARVAIVSAFEPELALLRGRVQGAQQQTINGVEFTTGTLEGKPVVLFLSGISMTNAAMNTQLALDRFRVSHLLVSGIAGGVNPKLNIGDVTVAERWGQYLEVLMARETGPGKYAPPGWMDDATLPSFGMLFPRPIRLRSVHSDKEEKKFWFEADAALLRAAQGLAALPLDRCDAAQKCLSHQPRVVVGGNGVSGQAFVDNAAFREHTFKTFQANVLDMETAAIAMVAYSNGVPMIAFRSLSDLAGGGEGENEIGTFFKIAADNSARVVLAFLAAWKP
ncbi:MAG: 5'-methylthioadenosine/S-adenosylhomocysteine nucleosidase [Pseudomonadota bacterium]